MNIEYYEDRKINYMLIIKLSLILLIVIFALLVMRYSNKQKQNDQFEINYINRKTTCKVENVFSYTKIAETIFYRYVNPELGTRQMIEESDLNIENKEVYIKEKIKSVKLYEQDRYLSEAVIIGSRAIAGDQNEFVVEINYRLNNKEAGSSKWGIKNKEDGFIYGNAMLKIKKEEQKIYYLENIATTIDTTSMKSLINGIENKVIVETVKPVKKYDYVIDKDNILKVTYDEGKSYVEVKRDYIEQLDNSIDKKYKLLQEGSYYITPEITAFISGKLSKGEINITISNDMGKTWNTYKVADTEYIRVGYISFSSSKNGAVVIGTNKTMSNEMSRVYLTNDGGKTWKETNSPTKECLNLINGASFSTDKIGFIAFKSNNYYPEVYTTIDAGMSWKKVEFLFPDEYQYSGIFIQAQSPIFNDKEGTLIIVQDGDGDFEGGGKVARFKSIDYGLTWKFEAIVSFSMDFSK